MLFQEQLEDMTGHLGNDMGSEAGHGFAKQTFVVPTCILEFVENLFLFLTLESRINRMIWILDHYTK